MKRVSKYIFIAIIALVIILAGGQVKAASASISTSNSKVNSGENVKVTVSFGGEKVSAVQFKLNYDSSKFEYVSNSAGSPYNAGTFAYASATADLSSVTFTFKAKSTGSSNFGLSGVKLSTASEKKVTPKLTKSSVSITSQEKKATTSNSSTGTTSTNNKTNSSSTSNKTNSSNKNTSTSKKNTNSSTKNTSTSKDDSANKENTNKEENNEETNNIVNEVSENTIDENQINTIGENVITTDTEPQKDDVNIWKVIAIIAMVIIIVGIVAFIVVIRKK